LQSFIDNPAYRIEDYIVGPGGWHTYNQFLARQLKPGKMPIDSLCDDSVIVSPADSEFCGQWLIDEASAITVKGTSYSISELLEGSELRNRFNGGIFTHSFLAITDYHRFHMPVSGRIQEVKIVQGNTWVTEQKQPDGSIANIDDVGFQFNHTRGYVTIDSPAGMVAVIPVGMGHISSVIINASVGDRLVKGDEFGYFAFGGSDIIMLFEKDKATLSAERGRHYRKGERIGQTII
jgi:phosphatidylserine decarboxylase